MSKAESSSAVPSTESPAMSTETTTREEQTSSKHKSAMVLDGKALAAQIEKDLRVRVDAIKEKTGRTPILATILVGGDPASATYVRMKSNACKRVGMDSIRVEMPDETTTEQLKA